MKRRDATAALIAAGLGPAAIAQGGPVEGRHYERLSRPLPATPGRVEVLEFFSGVQTKVAQGIKLAEAAGVDSVPALVVAGRWRTSPGMGAAAGQNEAALGQQALAVADFLIRQARAGKTT